MEHICIFVYTSYIDCTGTFAPATSGNCNFIFYVYYQDVPNVNGILMKKLK